MYSFGKSSLQRRKGVDQRLIDLTDLMIKRTPIDFGIAWMGGLRTAQQQHELYLDKASSKDGYIKLSKHQQGLAIDFIPFVDGAYNNKDLHNHLIIIGVAYSCASELGINIKSGLDWDSDSIFMTDQKFQDAPHIELINYV